MPNGNPSQLLPPLIVVGFLGWIIYRRTRPQQVRLIRTIFYTVLIVGLSLVGLVTNPRVLTDTLFLALAPFALALGLALGWLMMRTIRFWRDQPTGQIWMRGGGAYVAIWLVTLVLRLGVEYAATGTITRTGVPSGRSLAPTPLSVVASDLLFLSIGLWLARGYALVRTHQALAVEGQAPVQPQHPD